MDWDRVFTIMIVGGLSVAVVSLCFAFYFLNESDRYLDEARQNLQEARESLDSIGTDWVYPSSPPKPYQTDILGTPEADASYDNIDRHLVFQLETMPPSGLTLCIAKAYNNGDRYGVGAAERIPLDNLQIISTDTYNSGGLVSIRTIDTTGRLLDYNLVYKLPKTEADNITLNLDDVYRTEWTWMMVYLLEDGEIEMFEDIYHMWRAE